MWTSGPGRIVFCVGLYRSASTWIFNVCQEILRRRGLAYYALYTDAPKPDMINQIVSARACIVKSHAPDVGFCLSMAAFDPPVIISVRDPRDAVSSLMFQFSLSFEVALGMLRKSCEALAAMPISRRSVILRYESMEWRSSDGVRNLSGLLGHSIDSVEAEEIARAFSTDSVLEFLADLDSEHYFDETVSPAEQFHAETHFHPNHIGDGLVEKYRSVLSPVQEKIVVRTTADFIRRFDYAIDVPRVSSGETLDFALGGYGYLKKGFGHSESWGVWSHGSDCEIHIPLAHRSRRVKLALNCFLGPAFRFGRSGTVARIFVNGRLAHTANRGPETVTATTLHLCCDLDSAMECQIAIAFDQTMSPAQAGANPKDHRKLGLGLRSLKIALDDMAPMG